MDRADLPTLKRRLRERDDDPLVRLTPAERIALVWPITLHAWAFNTGALDDSRLRPDLGGAVGGCR